ncbi:MAG: RNHCP domain-containing protein [Oscillospiraceae bacterium]|nr:RNHCP domain-containing protein [Oscillospiraceae bacterium]
MPDSRRFTHIDEGFVCAVCGQDVPPLRYTARNHCRKCLCSLHVDINPGDRLNTCGGVLRPVGIEKGKKALRIVSRCDKCGTTVRNITAQDDDYDVILTLSARGAYENMGTM